MNTGNTARIIREIPATISVGIQTHSTKQKIRECAYARVSTDSEEQLSSYEAQCNYYERTLKNKPNTEYVGLFCDEAKSGKSISGRSGFRDMLAACRAGKIDRIVTKSVSRFARNLVECVNTVRELKEMGVTVFFESQGIDTKDPSSNLILTICAALAEEDIRTMSSNIKWGVSKRYAEGKVHMSGTMYGYRIKKGKFEIVSSEAIVIKQIFNDYLKGLTIRQIGKKLMSQGIPTPKGKKEWIHSTIKTILTNEKYKGDLILQKTYKTDVLSKRQKNNGQLKKYEIENNHLPIIEKDIFDSVQVEMKHRNLEKVGIGDESKYRYSSQYPFSTMIECGECGTKFRRYAQTHDDKKVIVWVCVKHQKDKTQCTMKPIKEKAVEDAFVQSLNHMVANRDKFINLLQDNIKEVLSQNRINDLGAIKKELRLKESEILQLTKQANTKQGVNSNEEQKALRIIEEIKNLQSNITKIEEAKETHNLLKIRLKELKQILNDTFETFNKDVFLALVDKILVITNKRIRFIFKCGIQIEQEI